MSDFWRGRRVFVTGHTGFKGAWLSLWLSRLGAEVFGYSLEPPTSLSLFEEANVAGLLASHLHGDVRDVTKLARAVSDARPEVVFHLAAQSLVRRSYREPRATWETNVLGTVNLLESVRETPSVTVCQVVTSDKCYAHRGSSEPFREDDPLGGADPYSASKAAAEIAVAAWRQSFPGKSLASVRAGNVIGGGDWAEDRLIPDCVRALAKHEQISIRYPDSVRPWQHVLEPLAGYLALAERQATTPNEFSTAFNFGPAPNDHLTVGQVVKRVVERWGSGGWERTAGPQPPETPALRLDACKATAALGWRPRLSAMQAVDRTIGWYRDREAQGGAFDARRACLDEIDAYSKRASST